MGIDLRQSIKIGFSQQSAIVYYLIGMPMLAEKEVKSAGRLGAFTVVSRMGGHDNLGCHFCV